MSENGSDWPPRRSGTPDDPLESLRELGERWQRLSRQLNPLTIIVLLAALYMLTGIYIVAPDERAVVLRFGAVTREAGPGPHYHLPWPAEQIIKVPVTSIRKEEIGFRTISAGPPARYRQVDAEATMLTGDNNIVELDFIVQYRVKSDPEGLTNFLFNVLDPVGTVRDAAEAAMREVIGASKIDDALTEGKQQIQLDAQLLLAGILDSYKAGIDIITVKLQDVDPPDAVSDAFKDVIGAEQDKERLINESRGYANDIVPRARGEVVQLTNGAIGYREAQIREAEGAANRFIAVYDQYVMAREVTEQRLYLETMEQILPRVNLMILDESVANNAMPYLPLDPSRLGRAAAPATRTEVP